MAIFLLHHRHEPSECSAAFAAWMGFSSPLRRQPVLCSCLEGQHETWWRVEAVDRDDALALLPGYVAERTTPIRTREVQIP